MGKKKNGKAALCKLKTLNSKNWDFFEKNYQKKIVINQNQPLYFFKENSGTCFKNTC